METNPFGGSGFVHEMGGYQRDFELQVRDKGGVQMQRREGEVYETVSDFGSYVQQVRQDAVWLGEERNRATPQCAGAADTLVCTARNSKRQGRSEVLAVAQDAGRDAPRVRALRRAPQRHGLLLFRSLGMPAVSWQSDAPP